MPQYCCECNTTTGLPLRPYPKSSSSYAPPYHICAAANGKPGACCVEQDREGIRTVKITSQSIGVATSMEFQDYAAKCPDSPATPTFPVNRSCSFNVQAKNGAGSYFYTVIFFL